MRLKRMKNNDSLTSHEYEVKNKNNIDERKLQQRKNKNSEKKKSTEIRLLTLSLHRFPLSFLHKVFLMYNSLLFRIIESENSIRYQSKFSLC